MYLGFTVLEHIYKSNIKTLFKKKYQFHHSQLYLTALLAAMMTVSKQSLTASLFTTSMPRLAAIETAKSDLITCVQLCLLLLIVSDGSQLRDDISCKK